MGYDYFGEGYRNLTFSNSLAKVINDSFGFYIEPFGYFLNFDDYQYSFDAGITYLVNKKSQIDFSFGTGINHIMNYISIGYSINIEKNN